MSQPRAALDYRKGAMSGRKDTARDLEPDYSSVDFLAGIGSGRIDRVSGQKDQAKPFSLLSLVRGVRDGRHPRLRRLALCCSRLVPESVLDWADCQLHDGTIWEPEHAGGDRPGDTCVIGHQARSQLDREVGWKVIYAALPILLLVSFMLTLFAALRVSAHAKEAHAKAPPAATHSSVMASTNPITKVW